MIIISSRKSFNNPDALSDKEHKFKEIDLASGSDIRSTITEDQLFLDLSHKKILMLVHGYNNEQDEVYDAYSVIEKKVNAHLNNAYDLIIGYSWPSGNAGLEWWASQKRADIVAHRFRFLIERISDNADSLDIMSHSLGARVVLNALKQSQRQSLIRNYYCTAPAVDNEALEFGEEFHDSVSKNGKLFVFHSKRDGVLAGAYRLVAFDNALGLCGPEDKHYIQNKTENIYVVNCKRKVNSHSAYKRSDDVYKYISSALEKKSEKFQTI